jgi:hypothetical protein
MIIRIVLSFLLIAGVANAATVDLTVREQYGVARTLAPVTTGVPLPETGGITDVGKVRLLDGATPIDAQFRVLSRWGGKSTDTSKPIQWLLVDSQVTAAANSNDVYTLEFGSSITTPAVSNPITHTTDSTEIVVDTGDAVFTINKTNFNILKAVSISGTSFLDTSTGAKVLDSFGTTHYGKNNTTSVAIEEDGDMRLVVVAKGWHQNAAGTETAFYGYTTRLHFYKGKSLVRVVHTVENRPYTPRGALAFQDYSIEIDLSLASGTKNYMAYGETETTGTIGDADKIYIYQDSDGGPYWDGSTNTAIDALHDHTTFKGYKIIKNTTTVEQHDQALGVLDISDATKGLTAGIHQFWQRNPKKIMAEGDGKFTFGILPDEFDYMFFVEDMSNVNTEIFLNFHTGAYSSTIRDEVIDRLHPMIFAAPPSWYSANTDDVLPDNTIFYNADGVTPQLAASPYSYITAGTVEHPVINAPHSLYDGRNAGFYSAVTYGLRDGLDRNGSSFEGPVPHFQNFMATGQPGASGDTYLYHPGSRTDDAWYRDYDLFWGGVDFAQHWMYQRASSLPEGWNCEDAGITSYSANQTYLFQHFYPSFGGRIASDATHTLGTLTPTVNNGRGTTQPSHNWPHMDLNHNTVSHIADYYHLTGDMAVIDYSHSESELMKMLTQNDLRADGVYDTPPAKLPDYYPLRGVAWPILSLTTMYGINGDDEYLNWAVEAAKLLISTQTSAGYWDITDVYNAYSIPQISKAVMALASLYKLTGTEQYKTIAIKAVDWVADYVANQSNHFLVGYYPVDSSCDVISLFADIVSYYDETNHQCEGTLVRWSGSDQRMFYMLAWAYQKTGNQKYKNILDANYRTTTTTSRPGYYSDVTNFSWVNLYLSQQINNAPLDIFGLPINAHRHGSTISGGIVK